MIRRGLHKNRPRPLPGRIFIILVDQRRMLFLQQRLDLEVVVDSAYLPCAVGLGRELRGGLVYFEDSVGIFIQPITVRTVIVLLLPDAEDVEVGAVALYHLERRLFSLSVDIVLLLVSNIG